MSDKETYDLIFPKNRPRYSTEIKSFSEIHGTMPTIIAGDEITVISPFIGPTTESLEMIKQMKDTRDNELGENIDD
jgi:hypothetical protein